MERRFLTIDPIGISSTAGLYPAFGGDPIYWIDPTGRKDFTLPDGTIDTSQVHNVLDFLDVMTTDFPYAVYRGLVGIPGQVAQRGHEMRADSYQNLTRGDLVTAPSIYGAGAAFEVGGSLFSALAHTPENIYNALSFHWRDAVWPVHESKREPSWKIKS